ncbi:hypothetical protein NDU88_001773 [Pleurodeles waltl]|uniref:Uncharacterized protein n=1 Tax=Pleurodeles waltl TaxID=8319 RepID=A0AAV7S8K8_PLEWA|nr:hypothetical protein NDU88_001773 [Pleurodeles waltl]
MRAASPDPGPQGAAAQAPGSTVLWGRVQLSCAYCRRSALYEATLRLEFISYTWALAATPSLCAELTLSHVKPRLIICVFQKEK